MLDWHAFMTKWYPEGDQADAATVFGYGAAMGMEKVLQQCGDEMTRANLMKQLQAMDFDIGDLSAGHPHQDLADRPVADRAAADDAVQGRELGVVRPDDGRQRRAKLTAALVTPKTHELREAHRSMRLSV